MAEPDEPGQESDEESLEETLQRMEEALGKARARLVGSKEGKTLKAAAVQAKAVFVERRKQARSKDAA